MPFFETVDQVFSSLGVFLFGFIIISYIRKKFYLKLKISYLIYIWHTLFCFVYLLYINNHPGDALLYYAHGASKEISFGIGTSFIYFLTYLFVNIFNLSFLGMFLLFNIFGTLGLLAFFASLNVIT